MTHSLSVLAGAALAIGACGPTITQRAMRSEARLNVDEIREAELAYHAAFDEFVAAAPAPRPPAEVDRKLAEWPAKPDGFDVVGWYPDGSVRGSYWVEVSPGGEKFTVHGVVDIDQDGEPAHYVATRDRPAERISAWSEL